MAGPSRYNISKPGADIEDTVLKNKLNIRNQEKLDDAETILLKDTYTHFFDLLEKEQLEFTTHLLFEIHKFFLSTLYSWAGKIRTINISKDNILFAPVEHIDSSLKNAVRVVLYAVLAFFFSTVSGLLNYKVFRGFDKSNPL